MHTLHWWKRFGSIVPMIGGARIAAVASNRYADLSPWAPANGWRKKNDPNDVGCTGKKRDIDYGGIAGRCSRQAARAVIGAQIDRDMECTDRACIAHALGPARTQQRAWWQSADVRAAYVLTPDDGFKRDRQPCREPSLRRSAGSRSDTISGRACRTGDGTWRICS